VKGNPMKVKITEKGVYDQDGNRVPVGATVDVKGDTLPGYLANKGAVVEGGRKTAVTNPAKTTEA